jgi:hypothetical protein
MGSPRTSPYIVAGFLLLRIASEFPVAAAQGPSSQAELLPPSTPLSGLEIRLDGGCVGRCVRYRITIPVTVW